MLFLSKNSIQISLVVAITTLLSACGFHLQGNYQLSDSLQALTVESGDKYSEITRLVTAQLKQRDVVVNQQKDVPILRLGKERFERGTMSLFSSGQVAEYELIYTLEYTVIRALSEPLPFMVTIRRDYLDDPQSAQAKSREREQLLREIRQQATHEILQQLSQLN